MRRGVLMALGVVSLCAVTLWCGRIFSVNRAYSDDTRVVEAFFTQPVMYSFSFALVNATYRTLISSA